MSSTYVNHFSDFTNLSSAIAQSEANAVSRQAILTTCCTDLLTAINAIPSGGNGGTVTNLPYTSPPGGDGGLVYTLSAPSDINPSYYSIYPIVSNNAGDRVVAITMTDRDENSSVTIGGAFGGLTLHLNIDKPRHIQLSVFTIKFGGDGGFVHSIQGVNLHSGLNPEQIYFGGSSPNVVGWKEIIVSAQNSYSTYYVEIYGGANLAIDEIELYGLVTNL